MRQRPVRPSTVGLRRLAPSALIAAVALLVGASGARESARAAAPSVALTAVAATNAVAPTASASAARAVDIKGWRSPFGADALESDLGVMLEQRTRSGRWGAMVVSLTRGDTLFAVNPDALLQPASTMKLMTTAVALDRFGPDHRFTTDVLRDGSVDSSGVLTGNLYLRGGGDPSLSTRFTADGERAPMDSLARLIQAAGIRQVTGYIVADATAFDGELIPDGWQKRYLSSAYAAPVSALSLNENLIWIAVEPSGKVASITLEPPTTTIPVVNDVRVTAGSGGRISAHRTSDGALEVHGTIGSRSRVRKYSYVIDDPAPFAGGALKAALNNLGITVAGQVRTGDTPVQAVKVASYKSQPLARIISAMNRESINHYAEMLYRDAAHTVSPPQVGSAATGLKALRTFLSEKVGADTTQILASDGSGLSVNDSLTARTMMELLSYAHHAPWGSSFHASLPVAGESELLRKRMKSTPAQGNLHAKTGTTNSVIALAGYVTAKDGEVLAFSFMYNGHDRWNAKAAMDQMGATLAEFVRE